MNTALVFALLAPAAEPAPQPDVRANVARGLKWLAEQQQPDGSWDGGQATATGVTTARAGIALLMEGSTPSTGRYAPQVRKAIDWFAAQQKDDGRIAPGGQRDLSNGIQSHAHGLLFLVSAHDADSDPVRTQRVAKLVDRAIGFAVECQTPAGAWGRVEPSERATGANGVQTCEVLHALLVARKAGFDVPRDALERAVRWLERSTNDDGSVAYTAPADGRRSRGGGTPDVTAGAAALALTGGDLRPTALPGWVRSTRRALSNYERTLQQQSFFALQQVLGFARVAYALGESGHDRLDAADESVQVIWSRERAKLFKAVTAIQKADGSWPDQFGASSLATAHALTILQLDNGYLPAFTR